MLVWIDHCPDSLGGNERELQNLTYKIFPFYALLFWSNAAILKAMMTPELQIQAFRDKHRVIEKVLRIIIINHEFFRIMGIVFQ